MKILIYVKNNIKIEMKKEIEYKALNFHIFFKIIMTKKIKTK